MQSLSVVKDSPCFCVEFQCLLVCVFRFLPLCLCLFLSFALRCEWVLEFSAFEMNTFLDKFIHQYRKEKENVLSRFFSLFNSNVICIRLWVRTPVVGNDSPILSRNYYFDSNVSHTCCIQWARALWTLPTPNHPIKIPIPNLFQLNEWKKQQTIAFISDPFNDMQRVLCWLSNELPHLAEAYLFFANKLIFNTYCGFPFSFFSVSLSFSNLSIHIIILFLSVYSNKSGVDRGALLILMCIAQPMFVMIDKAKTQNELNHF